MAATLAELTVYLDELLSTETVPDYGGAHNGLQIGNSGQVTNVVAAVDASLASIRDAARESGALLLVHHGLMWGGPRPVTGTEYERLKTAFDSDLALYSSHIPLDLHPDLGNNALLARGVELTETEPFGSFEGVAVGLRGSTRATRDTLAARVQQTTGHKPMVLETGPPDCRQVAIVTGSGSSFLDEAARQGVDTLVTGEAPHHAFLQAEEYGINLILGGHYATETLGVRALAERVSSEFGLPWRFFDHPTGL